MSTSTQALLLQSSLKFFFDKLTSAYILRSPFQILLILYGILTLFTFSKAIITSKIEYPFPVPKLID